MDGRDGLMVQAREALSRGDTEAAGRALHACVCSEPERARGYFNLGLFLGRGGDPAGAERGYRRAVLAEPVHEGALGNLSDLLLSVGHDEEAEALCADASTRAPLAAKLQGNLALLRLRRGAGAEAMASIRRSLCAEPGYAKAWGILAMLRHDDGPAAESAYNRAWLSGAHEPSLLSNRGEIAQREGRITAAIKFYDRALAMAPRDADILANRATASIDDGDFAAASRHASAALAVDPSHRVARWIGNWVSLAHRDFETGFRTFDETWRRPDKDAPAHATAYPLWAGGRLDGSLLLWCEHGVGDEILYAGMIDDVLSLGVDVVLETDPRLVTLFQRSWPGARVIGKGGTVPGDIAAQSSVLRLPMLFRRRLEDFPRRASYLIADPERVEAYRDLFQGFEAETVIGLSWRSGNPRTGAGKSTRLVDWDALLDLPGARFLSLQYDDGGEIDPRVASNPSDDTKNDLDDLAAQIAALDHVVSISGVTAHFAGALGVPGHVLLPPAPLWFWFAEGDDCPWYPSLTLGRRAHGEDWGPAVARLASTARGVLERGNRTDPT